MVEHLIEGILELIFRSKRESPEQMPEIEYKPEFVVRYYSRSCIGFVFFCAFIIGVIAMACAGNGMEFALLIGIPGGFCIFFTLRTFLLKIIVNEEKITECSFLIFQKIVLWSDIICVRIIEKEEKSSFTIALYGTDSKLKFDVETKMENAWYILKMAEHKGIEIRDEKDLSLKEIMRL